MKKLYILLLSLSFVAFSQTPPVTPTLGLYIPAHGSYNWDTWYNDNWNTLDNLGITVNGISASVSTINGEITTINGDITSLNGSVSTINGQVSTINGDIATLDASFSSYETSIGVPVGNYGAVCNGVLTISTGAVSGTDDSAALQSAFNALGSITSGIPKLILPPVKNNGTTISGLCLTHSALTIGNGSQSAWSTQQGFSIVGSGGTQAYEAGGSVTIGSGYATYFYPSAGSSIVYTGSSLGTTPVLTVQGPIRNINLQGFSVDCRYLAQTCIATSSLANSRVTDVMALNNLAGSNLWNAGWWISALASGPPGYSGMQNNVFDQWGAEAEMVNAPSASLIAIGCPDTGGSACSGTTASGLDVSSNSFRHTIATDFSGGGYGLILGYEDGNVFDNITVISYAPIYWLLGGLIDPGNKTFHMASITSEPLYMNNWLTSASIASTGYSVTVTTTAGTGSSTPLAGGFVQIGTEIFSIGSVSTISGGYSLTLNRSVAGSVAQAHTSGTAISGPVGYMIDGAAGICSSGFYPGRLYIDGLASNNGASPLAYYASQLSPNVCGVFGTTVAGIRFNSPGGRSIAYNPLVASQVGYSATASGATVNVPVYPSGWQQTVSTTQIGAAFNNQGQGATVQVRGLMLVSNTSGGSGTFHASLALTDNTGTTTYTDPTGVTIANNSSEEVSFDFLIKISYVTATNPYAATYVAYGPIDYLNTSSLVDIHALLPFSSNAVVSSRDISTGLGINVGGSFSAVSSNFNLLIQDAIVRVENADFSGIF